MSNRARNRQIEWIVVTVIILTACIFLLGRRVDHWRNECGPVHERIVQKAVNQHLAQAIKDEVNASSLPPGQVIIRIQVYQRLNIPKEALDWENHPLQPEVAHLMADRLMPIAELYSSSLTASFQNEGDMANCEVDLSKVNAQIDLHSFSCRDQIIFDRLFVGPRPTARFRDRESVVGSVPLRAGWAVLTPLINTAYELKAITKEAHRRPSAVEVSAGSSQSRGSTSQEDSPEAEKVALVTITALAPIADRLERITEAEGGRTLESIDGRAHDKPWEGQKIFSGTSADAVSWAWEDGSIPTGDDDV